VFAEDAAIREDVRTVKESVLELNRDLYELERELLSPATTRAAFHVTLNHGEFFEPLSIELSVDGDMELQHLYTERQVKALRMGAVQPLGDLNLAPGKHDVTVVVRGINHLGQGRELSITETVTKTGKPLITELVIIDREELQSARVQLKYW
jgi:hypothetical protein